MELKELPTVPTVELRITSQNSSGKSRRQASSSQEYRLSKKKKHITAEICG